MILKNKNAYPERVVQSLFEAQQFRDSARTLIEYKLFSNWYYVSDDGTEKEINIDSFNDDLQLTDLNLFLAVDAVEEFDFHTGNKKEISEQTEEIIKELKDINSEIILDPQNPEKVGNNGFN